MKEEGDGVERNNYTHKLHVAGKSIPPDPKLGKQHPKRRTESISNLVEFRLV